MFSLLNHDLVFSSIPILSFFLSNVSDSRNGAMYENGLLMLITMSPYLMIKQTTYDKPGPNIIKPILA